MPRRDPKQIAKTLAARAEKLLGDLRSDAKEEPAPAAPRPRPLAKESGRTITISTPAAQPPTPSPAQTDAPHGVDGPTEPDVDETPEAAAPDATAEATPAPPAEDATAAEAETEPPAEVATAAEAETEPSADDAPAAEGETEPAATDGTDQGAEQAEVETEPGAAAELAESPAADAPDEAPNQPQQKATTAEPLAPDTADEASSQPQPAMATDDSDEAVAVSIVAGAAAEHATATPQPTTTPEPTPTAPAPAPVPAPQADAGATPPQQQTTETDSDRRRRIALLAIVVLLLVAVVAAIIASVTDGNDTIEANVVRDTIEGEEAATDTAGSANAETGDGAEDTTAPSTAAEDTETQAADTEADTGDTEPAAGGEGEAEAETAADTNATSGTAEPDPEAQDANGSAGQGDVAESHAVVRDGQIVLEGAVPNQEAADAIVRLASEILGPENVVNNYVIDERAADPNLGSIRVDDPVLFEPGSSAIAADFEPLLGQALTLMTLRPSVTMTIVGHTDEVGGEQDRHLLSLQRAQAVERWLVDRGVDDARLTALGRGDTEPIAPNDTDEGRQLNRRIQVFIENLLVDG